MNITFGLRKGLAGFGLFLFALISCQKKDIPFGENFLESFTDIVIIDTLTPVISTYKLDSFATSASGTVLLGAYNDNRFGTVQASSYFRLGLPAANNVATNDLYDSLTFILTPNNEYYGDTTVAQEIKVHELTQTLELATGKAQFYNTTPAFAFNPVELGKRQFFLRPSRKDSIQIRLSDAKGTELFQKLKDKSTDLSNIDNFLRYFKGIHVTASPSAAILGYKVGDSTLKMRLYYREKGIALTPRYVDFPVVNTNLQFNQIAINRSGTPLQGLPTGFPTVPSASLDNAAYVQYSTGLIGRISFPSLQNLLAIDKAGRILRAELIIKPLAGTFSEPYRLPPVLNLSLTDRTNALGPVQASANLFTDVLSGENTGYTFDVTPYLQNQIMVPAVNRQDLYVYAPSVSAFNRLVIGDKTKGKSRIQVRIYYLVIK